VNTPRRSEFRQIVAIVMIAGALAACGVKGELDPPVAAASAGPAVPAAAPKSQAQTSQSERKVFTEESAVRRTSSPSVIPTMPPEEWSKARTTQQTAPQKSNSKNNPDEPFFLDKIL
jgi:predicted small lipoprotein YifL